ncbi:hypothetical protein EEAAV_10140 [Rahnella aceris]
MTVTSDITAQLAKRILHYADMADLTSEKSSVFGADLIRLTGETIANLLDKLEAERQRADDEKALNKHLDLAIRQSEGVNANLRRLAEKAEAEIAALKAKLANPVVLPAGYSTRAGHPFHEGERNVMIPNKHGDWLSRFDVEHAIQVAGFLVKDVNQ